MYSIIGNVDFCLHNIRIEINIKYNMIFFMAAVSLMAKTKLLRNICFDLNRKVAAKYDCLQIFNNLFAVPG